MKNNSLLELFLGLIFFIVVLYLNYKNNKKYKNQNATENKPLVDMYRYKIYIACILAIIFLMIVIITRLV